MNRPPNTPRTLTIVPLCPNGTRLEQLLAAEHRLATALAAAQCADRALETLRGAGVDAPVLHTREAVDLLRDAAALLVETLAAHRASLTTPPFPAK